MNKYNRLTALRHNGKKERISRWIFRCDCGNEKEIPMTMVKNGYIKSCGCLRVENTKRTHGMSKTPIYRTWAGMKDRCTNQNNPEFSMYGGRGITFTKRWEKFENFMADMGERPLRKSLDRIDNNGNYNKENCRWATKKEQQNNTRNNVVLEYNGMQKNIRQWSEFLNLNESTIWCRINRLRWPVERALSTTL